ncbi:MAG: hypothetical protein KKE86_00025 [Planctomycetes bacterium]|nr:hypothetical protein [Planctomycetota bacterium]MBU4397696.1 hypothetical protein [Planctomycetota bacterium]MCG2684863.1 hypothetical protein [Planctomycetales bacterium]
MRIQPFLDHHGIASNPFADEDAQTDLVFKGFCIRNSFHPAWDKIYGDPSEPATAVVFGDKGSGKTAIRLQIARHLADYNADHPEHQVFVVQYDDFNAFLDRFRDRFSGRRRRADRMLGQWRLWDHIDAILSLAVTQLTDRILGNKQSRYPAARDEDLPVERLDKAQVRDVMLLAACYDQSTAENPFQRWRRLRQRLRFRTWPSKWDLILGVLATVAVIALFAWFGGLSSFGRPLPYLLIAASWAPRGWRLLRWWWKARRIARNTRVLNRSTKLLCRTLLNFPGAEIVGQPLPAWQRTDDRYELLTKLQGVLRSMQFDGILVLVDRVDEPHLINGANELMRALVWPMLDNKFLKHPGLGLKMLLPIELERMLDQQDRDFHQRARLDKQNMIRSLDWTGQSLYDMANSRIAACAADGRESKILDLFEDLDQRRLMDAFGTLRVPRHLFKFMYRLLTAHCNAHTEEQPVWKISGATFESVLALYGRDQDASDRGVGAG